MLFDDNKLDIKNIDTQVLQDTINILIQVPADKVVKDILSDITQELTKRKEKVKSNVIPINKGVKL